MRKSILCCLSALLFLSPGITGAQESSDTLRLKIGNPSLKDKTMKVSPGEIYAAESGLPLSFNEMIRDASASRIVYVGETHNSLPIHQIQARIIRALYEESGDLAVGMEMFTAERQEYLNRWSLGILSRDEFIEQAQWYVAWNFNFGYYQDIFDAAKAYRLPIQALNAPRALISKIRMQGWAALSESEKKRIPQPDLSHEGHRQLIRAIFENMEDMPHAMRGPGLDKVFEGLYRAQAAWDEVMAQNIIAALQGNERKMVVLAGSGHCLYNLGINRRVFEKTRWPYMTVICVTVPDGQTSVEVSRSLADYVWGLEAEERPAFPAVGLRLKKVEGLDNLVIERDPIDGAALDAGFKKGDVLLSVDEKTFSDINSLRTMLARSTWGDTVIFRVLRDAEVKKIELVFSPPESEPSEKKTP